jgi:L-asparaginase
VKSFLLITTGGTIDKVYRPLAGSLALGESQVPEKLKLLGAPQVWEHLELMSVDSLEMTEAQRNEIAEVCRSSKHDRILITHGTDTLVETGKVIEKVLLEGTRVVMTGAMVPLSVKGSDGEFHLGAALAHLQEDGDGVFVSFHGELFPSNACRKNRELGRFVAID